MKFKDYENKLQNVLDTVKQFLDETTADYDSLFEYLETADEEEERKTDAYISSVRDLVLAVCWHQFNTNELLTEGIIVPTADRSGIKVNDIILSDRDVVELTIPDEYAEIAILRQLDDGTYIFEHDYDINVIGSYIKVRKGFNCHSYDDFFVNSPEIKLDNNTDAATAEAEQTTNKYCCTCGKRLNQLDISNSLQFMPTGYGSIYDGEELDINLCLECADELITSLLDKQLAHKAERNTVNIARADRAADVLTTQ